jgi:PAS domain S-box-containing protein
MKENPNEELERIRHRVAELEETNVRQRGAEAWLRDSEKRYREIFEHAPIGIYRTTPAGRILIANRYLVTLLGFTSFEELSARNLEGSGFSTTSPRTAFKEVIEKEGIVSGLESAWITRDQQTIYVREYAKAVRDGDGRIVYYEGTIEDITERKRAELALRESEEKHRSLINDVLDSSKVGIFILDREFTVVWINRAMEEYFNVKRSDVIGRDKRLLIREKICQIFEDPEEFAGKVLQTYESNSYIESFECHVIAREDRSERWLRHWSQPIQSGLYSGGRIEHYTDITPLILARKRERAALEHARKAEQVKSNFLANMSHEIRTPLNSILGFTQIIEDRFSHLAGEQEKRSFESIRRNSKRLMRTVHKILDLSQIESGIFPLQPRPLRLDEIVREVLADLEPLARAKGLRTEFQSRLESATIEADEYCITQALTNLIDNAVKYTEQGHVIVSLERSDSVYTLQISDTGIGISEEYRQRIFEPFTQESTGKAREFQGTGLGLTLTKNYLILNEVRIDVQSRKMKGTTFTLQFPAKVSQGAIPDRSGKLVSEPPPGSTEVSSE